MTQQSREEFANNPNNPNTPSDADVSGMMGSHPMGVGLGAIAAGAAAGAVGGALAGPAGAVAGVAVGAIVGGLAGEAAAETVNPSIETAYWREVHTSRPYATSAMGYDEFAPAYAYGWESFGRHEAKGVTFDSVETDLGRRWDSAKGTSKLAWHQAKDASRDAWNRVQLAFHSNHDRK